MEASKSTEEEDDQEMKIDLLSNPGASSNEEVQIVSGNDDELSSEMVENFEYVSSDLSKLTVSEKLASKTETSDELDTQKNWEINFGYDIVSDYPSSAEDAINLIAEADEISIIDADNEHASCTSDSKSVELNTNESKNQFESIPSAPSSSKITNYAHDSNAFFENNAYYPDVILQVPANMNNRDNFEKLKPYTEADMTALYFNQELHNFDYFVDNFIEVELKSGFVITHPLYELLTCYLTCRDNLTKNEIEFEHYMEDYKQFQEKIWNLDTSSLTEYGECQDGNPVSVTHKFKVARFNSYIYDKLARNIEDLEILTTEHYATNIFNVKLYKVKIEHFISSLCSQFNFLHSNFLLHLHNELSPCSPDGRDYRREIIELKKAISVLFSFQRRPLKDSSFIEETRQWLEKLMSVLLRVASMDDHLFIIHHIMRCPATVGKWGSQFIQPPVPESGSMHHQQFIDHSITTLAAILLPVKSREQFLQQMSIGSVETDVWVIVDSDGEDADENNVSKTALKENDLVSFLNQIPFSDIFQQILLVNNYNNEMVYDINMVTDRDVLRSIVIGSLLVNLLEKGIENYQLPMYKQFCKRLSRLIKHVASYISDHWEMYRERYTQRSIVDSDTLNRLQTEYDEFLKRVVCTLYTTHNKIGWQYLATLPFNMIASQTLWNLYQYLLHTNSENDVLMSEEFMETLALLPDDDIYYFLTTISNMALNRPKQDWLFIQTVTLQLFRIGFVNNSVRDKCMKSSRILIANLASKHPNLISDLLIALKKDFIFVGKFSMYLFKELPISSWQPNHVDTLTFTDWLLNYSLTSWESNLTRYIFTQLNWSFNLSETDLFLSRDFHRQIAIIIVKTIYTYTDDVPPGSGSSVIISQGMRQVSSMVRNSTPEQALHNWAWQIMSKLKLHLLDQPTRIVKLALTDPKLLAQIPDLNSDTEEMRALSEGFSKNIPIAYYAALLMSNVGHSMPLICESCWDYCEILIMHGKISHVLHVLQLTLPYYLESIESLLSLEKFRKVISKLITADQTYMKMAKNLIMTDFPRPMHIQFASLIQYHLDNFSKYCLHSPNQMVELWLQILSSVWSEDCVSVMYLMNTIFCYVFSEESLKQIGIRILTQLIENFQDNRLIAGGGLSSLVNWIGYGNSSDTMPLRGSLLPRSSTVMSHSPYFSFFALQLEEYYTQTQTQVWDELLKLLNATTGKANVDNCLKKACSNLKLTSFASASLAIYRWSQYALELPADHPILPLFWQRFFRLYLYRVPGNTSKICVGNKFFEGAVNGNYFKKIKKKLQDCVACYTAKIVDDEYEKIFINYIISLYKAFLFWVDETRLHEPDVFLPAFPAAYNPVKLSEILNGSEVPWLEYVDFDRIKLEQKTMYDTWIKTLYRDSRSSSRQVMCFPVDKNVIAAILDRLNSYDERRPPPKLTLTSSVIPEIPFKSLMYKSSMQEYQDCLACHFQTLTDFTRSYETERIQQKAAAISLLEAFRNLYVDVEVEEKFAASCDVASPLYKRRSLVSSHCAGPAPISIVFCEGRLNKTAKNTIEKADVEFQRLLKNNFRTPSHQVSIACIVIELFSDALCYERSAERLTINVSTLSSLQDVGVSYFYSLIALYDSCISEYFPTKLLLRKVVDKLGQNFIDEVESECQKLLATILVNPKLSSILISHFTPSTVSAELFVSLYRQVTSVISVKNVNFVLDLISKFHVKEWLNKKVSKYKTRSQLIEVLSLSLRDIGSQPLETLSPIHKFLRRDLCDILVHNFPEHYGEILHVVLRFSAEEKFSCDVWYDVLNSLLFCASRTSNAEVENDSTILQPGLTVHQIRDISRKYASELRSLNFQELNETVNILSSNFLKERLQYGLYGLYPKYSIYMEPVLILHSMVGHAVVASVLRVQKGLLADRICEKIWPILANLFSPWIVPYYTGSLHEPPAAWIQKLTEDRSVLLPWTSAESQIANKMMFTFTESVRFTLDALPASNVILSNVCQWYITQYARESVKEHILSVVQTNLTSLYWFRFMPSVVDLELVLKVIDQYLPVCHSFLGSVFIEIPWKTVIQQETNPPAAARLHVILLNLLIKLANEPNLRQTRKVTSLLIEAQQFQWHLVDAVNYEFVLNWFVMSYDPRVIVQMTDDDWNGIDAAAFDLLQVAAGYTHDTSTNHVNVQKKRQMFVKACVKMTLQWAHRYKNILSRHHSQIELALTKMLDRMEQVIASTVLVEDQGSQCAPLLSELSILINQPSGSILPKIMIQVLTNWLTHRTTNGPVLKGLFRVVGTSVIDHLHLGTILETCLSSWFTNAGTSDCDWKKVLHDLHIVSVTHPALEDTFIENNHILSLYSLAAKQITSDNSVYVANKVVHWIKSLKPSNDNESKLPLLWSLTFSHMNDSISEMRPLLLKLSSYFQQIINLKTGWALFGVIGMNKQPVPSPRCKLLCYALNAFLLMKLSEMIPDEGKDDVMTSSTSESEFKSKSLVSAECIRSISALEGLVGDKHYVEYKITIDSAVRSIKSKEVTLFEGEKFIITLAKQLYTDGYIHAFQFDNV